MDIDFGIVWDWPWDEGFINLLNFHCQATSKTTTIIKLDQVADIQEKIQSGRVEFKTVLDRATDCDQAFIPLIASLKNKNARIINDPDKSAYFNNRSRMHFSLLREGLNVPHTIFLSANEPPGKKLNDIHSPFVLKIATEGGGGGESVIQGVQTYDGIEQMQRRYPGKTIMVQENIIPRQENNRRCWFRVFYVCNKIIPCFWDDQTHVYQRLASNEEIIFKALHDIVKRIFSITGIEFFSAEIAQMENGHFVVVDYLNDQCDMRFQSDTPDGVPDKVIEEIVMAIIETI